jgi:hypothetical protein
VCEVIRRTIRGDWWTATTTTPDDVRIGDRLVPTAINVDCPGDGHQPALHLRLEVVDGVPQCRELRIVSVPGGREVRPVDLGAVREWVEELFAAFAARVVEDDADGVAAVVEVPFGPSHDGAVSLLHDARKGQGARRITPALLAEVVEVYRAHVDERPTAAVAAAFGVAHRTAALYVQRAREAGLLPPTTRGKRRA